MLGMRASKVIAGLLCTVLATCAWPATVKVQDVPQQEIHGRATLIPNKNPRGAEENWRAVTSFLGRI